MKKLAKAFPQIYQRIKNERMIDLQNLRQIGPNKPLPYTPKYDKVVSQAVWTQECLEILLKLKGQYGSSWKFKFVEDIFSALLFQDTTFHKLMMHPLANFLCQMLFQ